VAVLEKHLGAAMPEATARRLEALYPSAGDSVAGTLCNLCVRAGPQLIGATRRSRTDDLLIWYQTFGATNAL
jgi:hypothetical protein